MRAKSKNAQLPSIPLERSNDRGQRVLIKNLRKRRRALEDLLERANSHWEIEDIVYRLYHSSYKVRWAQGLTYDILKELEGLYRYGWRRRNAIFKEIMEQGLDQKQDPRRWVEALLHARYCLEMAVKYSRTVRRPLQVLPSGYAALLYLYGLR